MDISRRELMRLGGGAALMSALPGAVRAANLRVLSGSAFGSAWRLVLPETNDAPVARACIQAVVARIDARMSPFRQDSELACFNAAGIVAASDETCFLARTALMLARDSAGAFNPTLAPWGRRYGFGPVAIAPSRPAGSFQDVCIEGKNLKTVTPGLSLDLCAIAKGYALDEITRALDGLDFLIELGGEVAARGRHPSGRPWRMGIERPGTNKLQRMIEADSRALATSGDEAQGYTVGPRRYAPVLDPLTRKPVNNGVASVSVLAPTGLMADGLATAAMVLGPERSRLLLKTYDASALFLLRGSDGLEEMDVLGFVTGEPS